ncbi:MAG: hypothetical protein IAI50_05500, partial [Candidatus Eremiobacteraeota bacterium]|nr:hypothetical protein [Candidatus Eremiobacteraeota bacterium]
MIEPLERAPLRVRDAELAPATLGAGSVLTLPFGEIAGDFRPMDLPQRRGRARYELLVSNDTPVPVASFAYALDGSQPGGRLTWNAIVVPPHSAVALEIEIVLPRAGRSSRVVAELHFEESKLVLDAPPPSPKGGPFLRRTLTIVAGLAFFCIGGLSIAREPHVLALGAPDAARGGTPFQVAYALGNSSRAEYVVESPDGLQVRRGNLPSSSGAFTLNLPTADVSNGYDVRVTAQGLFGTDSLTTHVLSLPFVPPPAITTPAPVKVATVPSAARIAAVSLARDEVHGGEPIVVDYRTSAEAGSVRLIDQLGTIRAEALLSRHGRSIVIAPFVNADQDFRVVVTAERGGARDDAAVSVRVLQTTMPPPGAPAGPDAT